MPICTLSKHGVYRNNQNVGIVMDHMAAHSSPAVAYAWLTPMARLAGYYSKCLIPQQGRSPITHHPIIHGTSCTRYTHIPLLAQVIHGNYPQACMYMHDHPGMQGCRGM